MNKVLVTGLSLADPNSSEGCIACNYDYSWIFNHPSLLLWVDKIILTNEIRKTISKCEYPDPKSPLPEAIKILFDILESFNLIEMHDTNDILTEKGIEQICEQVIKDRAQLAKEYSSVIKLGDDKKYQANYL